MDWRRETANATVRCSTVTTTTSKTLDCSTAVKSSAHVTGPSARYEPNRARTAGFEQLIKAIDAMTATSLVADPPETAAVTAAMDPTVANTMASAFNEATIVTLPTVSVPLHDGRKAVVKTITSNCSFTSI